jgi:hypothetical protein
MSDARAASTCSGTCSAILPRSMPSTRSRRRRGPGPARNPTEPALLQHRAWQRGWRAQVLREAECLLELLHCRGHQGAFCRVWTRYRLRPAAGAARHP